METVANLTFNVAGVSVSVNTADADLLNELRRFNSNLEIVQELFTKQHANGGNIKDTAKAFNVSPAVVTGWIKNGMPFVDIDGMNKYLIASSVKQWLADNETTK